MSRKQDGFVFDADPFGYEAERRCTETPAAVASAAESAPALTAPPAPAPPPVAPPPAPPVVVEPVAAAAPPAPPRATSMDPTALVFLEEPIARKLAVAWRACGGNDAEWHDAAGLSITIESRKICKALRINGICRDGGVTDERALQYIAAILARPLQQKQKKG